ncbi:hypothetical protein VNO80_22447 [Phaseolus coccineus]|uniref:Transmembrane protein n=1 Tax=Phaseolus coccineus TaxID=3886 RepID=A0AAN9M471_PHACN
MVITVSFRCFRRCQLVGVRPSPPPPFDSSLLLATRPPRHAVSYWTCSKLCAICFVAGMVFGYSLRGRVKRWASNILKKLN